MDLTGQTLESLKALYKSSEGGDLRKAANTITTANGLVAYDLQAPAKNLYPVNTPLRNAIPRVGGTGSATHWQAITGIVGSGYDASGWVPEGQRAGAMSITSQPKQAAFVTIGEEEAVTYEAINAGKGFEDIEASSTLRLMQKMMLKEENAILGGNANLALGTPAAPTLTASGTGGALAPATYSVIVVALSYEGLKNSSLGNGVATSKTVTGQDGNTFVLNGGSSNKSANATQAVTSGQVLFASTVAIAGALGYAWFVGVAGSEKLEKITSLNSAAFTTALIGGSQQPATAITADCSRNPALAFDGLLNTALAAGSGAYVNTLATGVVGTGTALTASGRGSVVEIDTMFKTMWDNYQVSPTVLYVNSQELLNITNKVLSNASGPLLRYDVDPKNPYAIVAGGMVESYFNPFGMNGGYKIPVKVHPALTPGTILGYAENLPVQYQSNNVPNVAEVKARQDYYQIDWPIVTRSKMKGVYSEEVLCVYFVPAIGIINNIANG